MQLNVITSPFYISFQKHDHSKNRQVVYEIVESQSQLGNTKRLLYYYNHIITMCPTTFNQSEMIATKFLPNKYEISTL